jgi:hypothetical protein
MFHGFIPGLPFMVFASWASLCFVHYFHSRTGFDKKNSWTMWTAVSCRRK